ncbi:peptidase MA family metallohydrolase [Limnoglobus roseus]|uniref:Tetratricopeptide repeat protein n=1 Tax=Limnoglobus roseus TaxID=2598579 RepID=A0A5C1ARZ3_9BACT|nr:peptidase MA family metallohydrolase [Limnoglobus roseus]QEL19658.1 tetratricopeptide repeat protein [Limnoglobus roseus]
MTADRQHVRLPLILLGVVFFASHPGQAAEIADAEKLLLAGKYDDTAKLAADELAKPAPSEAWWVLKIRAEIARGKIDAAGQTLALARQQFPTDLGLLLVGYDLFHRTGQDQPAAELEKLIRERTPRTPAERIGVGRFLLARGTDAKEVLDKFYNPVAKAAAPPAPGVTAEPGSVAVAFATAELALGKNDRGFAADTLQKAPKDAARDPHFHYLLARAFAEDDRARATKAIADALAINPHHVESLLFQADHQLDGEKYADTLATLGRAMDVDPGEPRAWALRAVVAHLQNDAAGEAKARQTALTRWPANPEVEHLIGRKLSQDYRFTEGAAYQRQSLEKDRNYQPAKLQLCQDLLRLGQEAEGWKLASEVFTADGYNVVAHNLVTLRDHLASFRTLAGNGILLRMDAKEAELYCPRAMAVLTRARDTLGKKYGVKLDRAVTVEIFPRKQDFAVRTFGMPGADGFLGVCFGPVITANSPASQGKDPSNWEAVLWHEFCHTVTLHKSRNKMPRWLSEGISVYEEAQENPAWGQRLTPRYHEMITGDGLTPLSQLSSAFMNAKSALHVQFAYFESALAVEFLITKFKFEALTQVLDDLGAGLPINESLERRTGSPLAKLDADFAEFARGRAKAVAPEATWDKPELPADADSTAVRGWLDKHPKNFFGLVRLGQRLVREEKWSEAETTLKELQSLFPQYIGAGNAYESLAAVYRHGKDVAKEAAILEELAKYDADALTAFQRLAELAEANADWPTVARNARRMLAVNPLIAAPHRTLAKAAEQLKERDEALAGYRAALQFAPPDAADLHYRLAVLHDLKGERDKARREVLKALEDAPRLREAHKLLLKLTDVPAEKTP